MWWRALLPHAQPAESEGTEQRVYRGGSRQDTESPLHTVVEETFVTRGPSATLWAELQGPTADVEAEGGSSRNTLFRTVSPKGHGKGVL